MFRRSYLHKASVVGLIGAAGCTGGGGQRPVDGSGQQGDSEGDGVTSSKNEGQPSGKAEVGIVGHDLVINEGEYTTDVYVAAQARNAGNAPSGSVELTAEWYDTSGNYIGSDTQYLRSLGVGETWDARVYYLGAKADQIGDYKFNGRFTPEPPQMNPAGLELVESSMQAGDEVVVTGRVRNNRDSAASYIESIAKIYGDNDNVLGDAWTNVTELPAGEVWAFETSWTTFGRADEVSDHTVWVTDTV